MSSRKSRLCSGLAAALLVAACGELPPAPPPPPPPPAPVASVTVSPSAPSILVGTAVQLSAATKDAQGNTLGGRAVAWSSSAEAVATVNATGLVTGVAVGGPVTITATSEGQLGTAQVVVTAPPLPGYTLSLSASTFSIAQGQDPFTVTTVDLVRSNFTGNVTLSVENLPTGVEAFTPTGGTSGSSSYVVLAVDRNAPAGTYTNLLLRGVASGLADRTAPLTLTITVAPFLLTLSSATLSIVQGAATPTTVNVIRDNFTGPVDLYVAWDGEDHGVLPPGVTAAFAPSPATGNSAVLTLTVGAAATPGVYRLFVSGGASTGGFCCIPLTLTVTAPPPGPPGYTLSLPQDLTVSQGSSSLLSPLYLFRSGFTGSVTLNVDSLPTGVTAVFYPVNPTADDSTRFWLSVDPSAVPGTYPNLLVRGVAEGLDDRTAPLTLTITVAPFILTVSSDTLSIVQGGSTPTTTVSVVRHNFTGPVTLYIDGYYGDHGAMPTGVTAAFAPNPATGNSSVLTVTVSPAAVPGVYDLWLSAEASTGWFDGIPITLIVTAASP